METPNIGNKMCVINITCFQYTERRKQEADQEDENDHFFYDNEKTTPKKKPTTTTLTTNPFGRRKHAIHRLSKGCHKPLTRVRNP